MMPFTHRLQFLLEKYDSLILQGFGAFYARYQTAQWHPVTHRIIPPQKEISFNRAIDQSDGILENELKVSFELTQEESQELVNGIVAFLLEELEKNKKLTFEGVGELVVRPDGSWRFIPFEENQLLPDSFGLTPIQVRPVLRHFHPTPVLQEGKGDPIISNTPNKRISWTALAATFVIFALALALFWNNPFQNNSSEIHHPAQVIPTTSSSFDSVNEEPKPSLSDSAQVINDSTVNLLSNEIQTGYYIIVGSTTSKQEAEKLAMNRNWIVLPFPELGRYRLAIDHFISHKEATDHLEKVRFEIDAQAWVLKQ